MIEFLYCVIELCILIYLVHYMNEEKMKWDSATVLLVIADLAILEMANRGIMPKKFAVVMYALTFLYFRIHLQNPLTQILKTYLMSGILIAILQMGIGSVVYVIMGNLVGEDVTVLVINSLVAICVLGLTYSKEKEIFEHILKWTSKHKLLTAYIGICIASGVLVFKVYGKIIFTQMLGIFIFGATIITVIVMWQKEKERLEREKVEVYKEGKYINDYSEMISEIRRKQHDFDNQLSAISGMYLTADSLEELLDKQEKYRRKIVSSNKYNKMANENSSPVIIGFLYNKFI